MNRIKSFGLLPAAALIFSMAFSSASAFAQTGTIEVTCEGPTGAPEKDVQVHVLPLNAKGKDKKSNASGVAVFDKLENGVYRVVGRKSGFAPAFYEFAVVNNGAIPVALKLTAGADRKFYFEDPALERQANSLLDQGLKTLESGDAAGAEKLLAQALEIKPSGADILFYFAMAQVNQDKFDQAVESFKKAADSANIMLSSMPKPKPGAPSGGPTAKPGAPSGGPTAKPGAPPGGGPKPKPGMGPGGPMAKPGAPPGGGQAAIYEMIAKNAGQQISMMPVLKAETAYGAKKFDEAVVLYDEAIKSNPQNPTLYSNKALALAQSGKLDEALVAVNRALEMAPGDERAGQVKKAVDALVENASREKANTLLTEGNKLLESDASAALKRFEEANKISGEKQAVIWRQVGRARAKLKQDAEAVAAFKKSIELAPADQLENYQMSLAQYYLDEKRQDEALDIVVAGSKDPERRLMDLFIKTKNSPNSAAFSLAALERVVKLNPMNLDAVFELGQAYYMDRKDDQARELLTRYVENGKDDKKIQDARDLLTVIASRNKNK
ncbi:MAG: tetratricopeptide repeat protein [Acidobacteriota bacterium]|jgi:tetratricopeptide (TPR) repeat protein|nr:tetratricopeptide repeat protein [Acidobacteriota bacterium]